MLVALSLYVYFVSSIEYGMFAQDVKDAGVCNQKYKYKHQRKYKHKRKYKYKYLPKKEKTLELATKIPPNITFFHQMYWNCIQNTLGVKSNTEVNHVKYVLTKILKCVKKSNNVQKNSTWGKQWG